MVITGPVLPGVDAPAGLHRGSLMTPVGVLVVESDGAALRRVSWQATQPVRAGAADAVVEEAIAQLEAYFAGARDSFSVPFDLGPQTAVSQAVLMTLFETVCHGETVTYGELALRSGTGIPARAIGSIMGANPIPVIVPCHRVVASDGLGGYSGGAPGEGLLTKRRLLEHEGALPTSLF